MPNKFFTHLRAAEKERIPVGQKHTHLFPILTYGETQEIDPAQWQLKVWGLASSKEFALEDLMKLPHHDFTKDFHCVTRWSKLDVKWKGIKVTDFIKLVDLDPQATHVMQHCYGGYSTNLTIDDFVREDNFFAFKLFDKSLSAEHGGPIRTVIPHLYAWKSAKWINGLEFLDHEKLGLWERNGYHRRGDPWLNQRYDA